MNTLTYADYLLAGVLLVLAAFALLGWMAVRRTREPAIVTILGLTAYWTLVGGIPVLMAKRVDGGLSTSYIEDKLFFIYIDEAYALTLLAYSAFMLLAVILVFLFSPSHQQDPGASKRWERVSERFSHPTLLMIVALVTVAKLAVVAILVRANGDTSLYLATRMVRGETASYIRVYQYLNIISSYSLAAGLSLWLAFPRARQARSRLRASLWVAYLALGLEVLAENALLGNRAVPLLVAGAVAVAWIRWRLIPAARTERGPLITRFIMLCFLGLLAVGLIGVSRGGNLSSPTAVLQSLVENAARPEYILESIQSSNEKLSAHMALYGVIREDPQLSPLASSSYDAYAQLVHAPEDQGFTIHYVAAWWVRSGSVGVLLAALTYALVIVGLHRLSQANRRWWTAAFALPAATLPAIGVPFIMLRSGPESMRGVVIEFILIPGLVCLLPLYVGANRRPTPFVTAPPLTTRRSPS